MKNVFKIVLILPFLCSCSITNESYSNYYLNYNYKLIRCGDLHGLPPTSNEVLDRNPGFTSYIGLFDTGKSFINYQCVGNSFFDFRCETTFSLFDNNGFLEIDLTDPCFYTIYDKNNSIISYQTDGIFEQIGTIYVCGPYWCRTQHYYDVGNNGAYVLLTFEFWKNSYNPLPDFVLV